MRILYLDLDTLRPDHLGCYGYERDTSPAIDRLAAEGVRFTSCYASDTPCLPSRTAMFSGRLGIRTGVVGHAGASAKMRYPGDGHTTDPQARPLPLVLSQAGVDAVTFSTFHQRHLAWYFTSGWREVHRFTESIGDETAADLEAPALEWLRRNGQRDSWFLHLHFWDPHTPYNTPAGYGDPFADAPPPAFPSAETLAKQLGSYGPTSARDFTATFQPSERHPREIRDVSDIKRWIDGYDTGIRYLDDTVARIMQTLADLGVLDETAVILTGDHGENQGELNLYGSHCTADAITARVPLIVRWPGLDRGTVREEAIYQLDLAPTLCELLGVDAPAKWDGMSFAPALTGGAIEQRPYLVIGHGGWSVQRSVLHEGLLYIRTLHAALDPLPDEMLFDLTSDPHEEHDLAESRPQECLRMGGLLNDWWHRHAAAVGEDPLLSICREGGSLYVRGYRDTYIEKLRATGRGDVADELARRPISPIVDPFDLTRH